MGLSETILAAMIGAMATVSAAIFQIYSSIKSRNKIDVKPRKGSAMRSILAVLALMIASAVGGFLYSELLRQRENEDLRAMRSELRELKELTAAARQPDKLPAVLSEAAAASPTETALPVGLTGDARNVESVAYVPACRRSGGSTGDSDPGTTIGCAEADAQRIALCTSIPAYARVEQIDLFAQPDAVQHPWNEHRVALEQDLGGARFTGKSFEYAQGGESKAVCVNFLQWSSEHSHIARMVLTFGFGDEAVPPVNAEAHPVNAVQTVIGADPLPSLPEQASFVTSIKP